MDNETEANAEVKVTKTQQIHELNLKILELEKRLVSAENTTEMYRTHDRDKEKEMKELHSIFDAIGVLRQPAEDTCSYGSNDFSIGSRFSAYLQEMTIRHMEIMKCKGS